MSQKLEKLISSLNEYELELLTPINNIEKQSDIIEYKCLCNNTHKKTIREFIKKPLKNCCEIRIQLKKFSEEKDEKFEDEQLWKKLENIWISNKGNAVNINQKKLTLDSKGRYFINKKHMYASRLMATAFKIQNYEKLNDQRWVVSFKDNNNQNLILENLIIKSKSSINSLNGSKSRQSEEYKESVNKSFYDYKDKPYKIIKDLPDHLIFEDGSIFNNMNGVGGKRFIIGSKCEGYLYLCTKDKTYKIHRLICIAFKPIEGKDLYDDYKSLQVNHIDGNKLNNHKDNLEWVEQSENINHAYENNLNKKVRAVIQFQNNNGEYGDIIKEFPSLAKASRETNIPEHEIREIAKGKIKHIFDKKFLWKYKNEEETESYRQKFSSKLADR